MTKKINLLVSVAALSISIMTLPTYANTTTSLTITKTTVLTHQDAANFSKTFKNKLSGDKRFSFKCDNSPSNKTCEIVAKKTGFSGRLAQKLLAGRQSAKFTSHNKKFTLDCGRTSVAFCNVIQKDAILR